MNHTTHNTTLAALFASFAVLINTTFADGVPRQKASVTHGPIVGHVTRRSAQIWARFSHVGEYSLVVKDSVIGKSTRVTKAASTTDDLCVVWTVDSLNPGRRYRYSIHGADRPLVTNDALYFETATDDGDTRIAFGSCAREDESTSTVWHQIRKSDPHAVVLLGDTPYIDTTDVTVQRRRYQEFAAVPAFHELVRTRAFYATWDDHDFGRNDTDGNVAGKENARRVFVEYHANPSYGDGETGIYTRFRRGPVEVFLLDTRYFAATEPSPFDATKPTLLGRQQWRWLKSALKASTAPFKVLACGMIWNGAVRPGKLDHWATYPHERSALFNFIGQERITGVVLIGGDVHRSRVLRHSTVRQAGYKIPELITSPIHDGVIETANAPHPDLVHDSGEPNTFLLLTAASEEATLTARFLRKDGTSFYSLEMPVQDLTP